VLYTIKYLSEWLSIEQIPLLIKHGDRFWDSVTIEQHFGYKPLEHLAQGFTDLPHSKTALSA
jgi:hypothetical protein